MTPKSKTEIRELAKPFEVTFVNQKYVGRDAILITKNFIFIEGGKIR